MLQIYPEGELIDGCRTLRAFQPGAFQIACWFRKPMIPCLLRFYPQFFQKRQTKKGRNGAGYFRAGGHSDR